MLTRFEGPVMGGVVGAMFASLLVAACVSDLRTRRIPNALVLVIALLGIGIGVVVEGPVQGGGRALLGLGAGLGLWLPFWLLKMMGAGDVKLFAAGAAWLGPAGALEGALLAGLCGGFLSILYLLFQHGFSYTLMRLAHGLQQPSALREVAPTKWDRRMPYGLAMAAGLLIAAWRPGILL